METNEPDKTTADDNVHEFEESEVEVDPINDIIDYLVRCAKISFKNAHVNESEVHTSDKIKMACEIYKQSPTDFLLQFGKYLAPHHIGYFENIQSSEDGSFRECINQLKTYHSDKSKCKRIRNRRYNALQRLQNETDYFSEKQMMYRNPLLYEQLVGQYLSDEEIKERDGVDNDNLTLLSMILETVDRNDMREMKNEQLLEEDLESMKLTNTEDDSKSSDSENIDKFKSKKQWGAFDTPDTRPNYMPEPRKQSMISAPERNLLRGEFLQEMFCSFIEGRDTDVDYNTIDNNEEYDDLQQVSQDAEDRYFDTESNDIENLEEHMKLVQEYGRKNSGSNLQDDPLDEFMKHITNKLDQSYIFVFFLIKTMRSRGLGRVSACGERVRYEWARALPHADSAQTSCGKRAGAARADTVTFVYSGVLTDGRTNIMFLIKQHILLLLFLVTVTTSRSFSSDLVAAHSAPINQIANVTFGAAMQNQASLTSIFSPRMDFEQWKPLTGRGDPLRNDPTYDYEPPVLERVHYWAEETRLEREHYPERKSEVLMLGVSSRKPSVTSRQPPLPPRRHVHRPQPNKYEDFTYKLSDHYPMTILVPPPPPPPGHQPPLFILSDDKAPISNKAQSPMNPNNSPQNVIQDSTTVPEHLTSLYALQESNLIYQSSTTTQNWLRDSNETKILENAVSSDYAGWGPTTPVDDNDAANDTHNLIFNDHIEFSRHPYSFYKPMLSESPPPPKAILNPSVVSTFIPTALPPTTAIPDTVAFTQVTWPTERTIELLEVTTETPQDTTEKRTTIVFEPTPVPTTTIKLETSLFDMLGPMMSMPMVNGPERPEDNLYAHASETVNIFNENKPEDPQIETMQTMQPPPPVKPAESSTAPHKQQFHVNSQVSDKKSALYTHGPYLHNRFTTPIPTTIEEYSEILKETTETPTVPMYLIIQGHSKVKTYGSKPKVPDSKETVNNEISKPLETNEVKHLHPIIKKSARKFDFTDASRNNKAKNLKSLIDSGLGSIEIQETDVGIKYDVSDGSNVPIEIYRKGIVDNDENNYSNTRKSAKELRRKRQIELEDLLPFDEEAIDEFVYNFLEGRKNETGITGLIAQAVTSDAAQAVDELEDDDDSDQEEER